MDFQNVNNSIISTILYIFMKEDTIFLHMSNNKFANLRIKWL